MPAQPGTAYHPAGLAIWTTDRWPLQQGGDASRLPAQASMHRQKRPSDQGGSRSWWAPKPK